MSPEQVMRSRYAAYSRADIDYIQETMTGKAAQDFDPVQAKAWAESVEWLGLDVIDVSDYSDVSQSAYVEFKIRFNMDGETKIIHERSEFQFINGVWLYVDGIYLTK